MNLNVDMTLRNAVDMPGMDLLRPLASRPLSSFSGHHHSVTVKGALGKAHHKMMTREFREFARIMQARLTLLTSRSVVRRNIATAVLERPREVCPSLLHEKPTSPYSTGQALRGNGGISRARAESNIADRANINERFCPPIFSLSTNP